MLEEPLMVERKSARGSRQLTNGKLAIHPSDAYKTVAAPSRTETTDRVRSAHGSSAHSRHVAESGPVQPLKPYTCACGKSFRNALGLGGHKATCKASVVRQSIAHMAQIS